MFFRRIDGILEIDIHCVFSLNLFILFLMGGVVYIITPLLSNGLGVTRWKIYDENLLLNSKTLKKCSESTKKEQLFQSGSRLC